ncbi:MAG: hypothetical protein Q7R79_03380, partial [bacterium]|nr:hypothetical protein [bacterium]
CGNQVFAAMRYVAKQQIADGEVAYLASHNPLCEATLSLFLGGVSKMLVKNFGKGDMVLFVLTNDKITGWHYLPVPPEPTT